MGHRKNDQLRILGQRFKSLGMSRRNFMKIAAAAAAGTVTTAGMERYVGPGVAAAPRGVALRQEVGPDEKFYHAQRRFDPISFDWNLNLYAQAEEETFLGSVDVRCRSQRRPGLGGDVHLKRGHIRLDVQHPA